MGDILRQLPFQDILFPSGGLDTLIHLDDAFSNFTQFIIREFSQILYLQALVVVGLVGEDAELSHILAQPMGESVEHDGQEDDGENGKPDVMLVSLQRFREIIIIRQGTSDDDRVGREIGSHIEVILL